MSTSAPAFASISVSRGWIQVESNLAIQRYLGEADDQLAVVDRLARGGLIGFGFGNIYALAARPDVDAVRSANLVKGRPRGQVGSVVTTPIRLPDAYDWSRLPAGLTRTAVLDVMDVLLAVGPIGFRGPAADSIPDHLTQQDSGARTTQVISPGYACPSNALVRACLQRLGSPILFITSANRSHHVSAAREEPAHYRGDALAAEFGNGTEILLLRHRDEELARARYPLHAPMSTTLLAFHRTAGRDSQGRIRLILERHGSLSVEEVGRLLHPLGFDLVLGPDAGQRLPQRAYATWRRWRGRPSSPSRTLLSAPPRKVRRRVARAAFPSRWAPTGTAGPARHLRRLRRGSPPM